MKKKRFIPFLAALALCAEAVLGQQPDATRWAGKLADGTAIDEEWMVQFVVEHLQAVDKHRRAPEFDTGKIEDYPRQPLKGATLNGIDLTLIIAKAVALAPHLRLNPRYLANLDLSGCQLCGARLENLWLERVYLSGARLAVANLSGVRLTDVNLSRAELDDANLAESHFTNVDATGASFWLTTLNSARFTKSRVDRSEFFDVHAENLAFVEGSAIGAQFWAVELRGAQFFDTNVEGARFEYADLFDVTWEARGKPDLATLALSKNLVTLRFVHSEIGLVELRKAFMEAGIRGAERKVNYALQRARTDHLWNDGLEKRNPTMWERMARIEVGFRKIFFDWTCLYGLDPGHALGLIVKLFLLCAIPYTAAMFQCPRVKQDHLDWKINAPPDTTQSGIWAVPLEKRVASGSSDPALVHVDLEKEGWGKSLWRAVPMGLFFSVISAFSTGYKDLDVGRWIERIKFKETTLRATGWVRSVSGVQSLVSFYLLVLWLLTYFGRPFE